MRHITIHAPIHGFVAVKRGSIVVELPNKLLHNFYRMLYGILSYQNVSVQKADGAWATWRVQGDNVCRYLGYSNDHTRCRDTSELPFNAYNCDSITVDRGDEDNVELDTFSDRVCSAVVIRSSVDANSNMITFFGCDPYGNMVAVKFNHVVLPISADQVVNHRVCFYEPWLKNMARIWCALFCDCDLWDVVDINGTSFNIRGSGQIFGGAVKLLLGYGTSSFSFDDYTLSSPVEIDTYVKAEITDTYAIIRVYGYYRPSQDEKVYEIGLKLPIYDPDGNLHDVLILRHVNPDGYDLIGGKVYIIEVYIYGE